MEVKHCSELLVSQFVVDWKLINFRSIHFPVRLSEVFEKS